MVLRVRGHRARRPAGAARADLHRGLVHQGAPGARQARPRARPGAPARRAAGRQRPGRPTRDGGGAEFTVVLPEALAETGPTGRPPRQAADRRRRRRPRRSRDDRRPGRGRRLPGRRDQRRLRGEGARLPGRRPAHSAAEALAALERGARRPGPARPLPAGRDRPRRSSSGCGELRPQHRRDHGDGGPRRGDRPGRDAPRARCSTWSSRSPSPGCAPSWRRTPPCAAPWTGRRRGRTRTRWTGSSAPCARAAAAPPTCPRATRRRPPT